MNARFGIIFFLLVQVCFAAQVSAQLSETHLYEFRSGTYENSGAEIITVSVNSVVTQEAPWLRVHLGAYDLGKRSYVTFTALEDGLRQRHDAGSLAQWDGWSAFFNGDTVDLELHIAPGDDGVFIAVDKILVGIRDHQAESAVPGESRGPCDEDSRSPSGALRICRFIDGQTADPHARCTGWIIASGAILTAGHCDPIIDPDIPIAEFDIPASDCDGTVNFGDPDHQYVVDLASIVSQNEGVGADWAILQVFPNPNTGLMPAFGEGAFARLGRDYDLINPETVRITGCGLDDIPAGCTGHFNSDNRTLQTRTGDFVREDSEPGLHWLEFDQYIRSGDSGSPIVDIASTLALGIVTHSQDPLDCPAFGQSFNHNALEVAINTFLGVNTAYVDQGHPITLTTGKIFRPWKAIDAALADVAAGGILSIVEGQYMLGGGIINQNVRLTAPVGPVLISAP